MHYKFLFLILLFYACKNEQEAQYLADFSACHDEQTWDSTAIRNRLVDQWRLEYIRCSAGESPATSDFTIEFKADNTLEVTENGVVTQTAAWKLKQIGTGFTLVTTPSISEVAGGIHFCFERVEFNYSNLDLCDHYFRRF
jgi:hypothetical protein